MLHPPDPTPLAASQANGEPPQPPLLRYLDAAIQRIADAAAAIDAVANQAPAERFRLTVITGAAEAAGYLSGARTTLMFVRSVLREESGVAK